MQKISDTQRLKTLDYTGYGAVSFGKVAIEMLIQLYLLDFYVRLLGLPAILAGSAFAIAIFLGCN